MREKERERMREIFKCEIQPKMAVMLWAGLGQSQAPGALSSSSTGVWQVSKHIEISHCLSKAVVREMDLKWSSQNTNWALLWDARIEGDGFTHHITMPNHLKIYNIGSHRIVYMW